MLQPGVKPKKNVQASHSDFVIAASGLCQGMHAPTHGQALFHNA
jgi:hypothetical protein